MKIEEYIKLRKTQDQMNEFDVEKKISNLHQTIDYVFEFYSTYVDIDALKKRQIEQDEKLMRYQKQLTDYSIETQNWILRVYAQHGTKINMVVKKCLRDDMIFQLLTEPSQIRKVTFNTYAKTAKKYPFLEDYTEELFQLISEYQKILNFNYRVDLEDDEKAQLPDEVISFVKKTRRAQHVDLISWASNYANWFFDQESLWPASHKIYPHTLNGRDRSYPSYNLKVKKNRFNLDTLYTKLGELLYLKNKKRYLETLIMYTWFKEIDHDDEGYYPIYLKESGYKL